MKKVILVAAIAIAAGFSSKVSAQSSTASADAQATIITPIAISKTTDLNFGVMSVSATTAGTCVLSTSNGRTATGGVNLSTTGTQSSNAAYTITGQEDATFAITLPGSATVTKEVGVTMNIKDFTARVQDAGADATTGTLTGGTRTMSVGATLEVAAGQATGVYNGSFDVTVAYN